MIIVFVYCTYESPGIEYLSAVLKAAGCVFSKSPGRTPFPTPRTDSSSSISEEEMNICSTSPTKLNIYLAGAGSAGLTNPETFYPEKCGQYLELPCSCPIYVSRHWAGSGSIKNADESADSQKIRLRKTVGRIQLHLSGLSLSTFFRVHQKKFFFRRLNLSKINRTNSSVENILVRKES